MPLGPEVIYTKYVAWCRSLGITPAAFPIWERNTASLEFSNQIVRVLSAPRSCEPGYEVTSGK
jgi:hypothetical protein